MSNDGTTAAAKGLILFSLSAVAHVLLLSRSSSSARRKKLENEPHHYDSTVDQTILEASLRRKETLNATERVCTVDENNVPTPLGHDRAEMRIERMWHRSTGILIFHTSSELLEEEEHVLVQRRSNIKDYCPGLLDLTPGGVVGYGESYSENATREIQEEMGIDVHAAGNSMTRLFTFPYQDDKIRTWVDLYRVQYSGRFEDICIQQTEVDEVLRIPLREIQAQIAALDKHNNETGSSFSSGQWTPDSVHAMKLYLQYSQDNRLQRRRLQSYSTGDLDRYRLRPKPRVLFVDCDDCLYFDHWKVASALTNKIEEWCVHKAGLKVGKAYELYKTYGTALKGLLAEGHLRRSESDRAIHDYLEEVHDLPISDMLSRDDDLRNMLLRIDPTVSKYVFTASVRHHAERCLKALGIDDLFDGIIDVKATKSFATKYSVEAFQAAYQIATGTSPENMMAESCLFVDDSVRNIEMARKMGWRSVLVGKVGRDCGQAISCKDAECEIDGIKDLPLAFPELFV